jgi:uncharacterized protein YgiM (DUF1202 family)
MKAILSDELTRVYSEPNAESISMLSLRKGEECEIGKVHRKFKQVWVEVTLSGGQTGYIPGATRIFAVKQVEMLGTAIDLLDAPADDGKVIKTYPKNTILTAIGVEKVEKKTWVRVRDASGVVGYIDGAARYKAFQEPTKAGGRKLMITGAIFAALAVVFMIMSIGQKQTADSGFYLIIGVLALGGVQLIQGYLQYRKAAKKESGEQ